MKKEQEKMTKTSYAGVYRLADGRLWVRATATCPRTGKKLEVTKAMAAKATVHDAQRAVAVMKAELLQPSAQATTRLQSLNAFVERWLEVKSARVRKNVADHYADNLARHILPRLGALRLDQLRRSDLEEWVIWAEQVERPGGGEYAGETVLTWWRLLTQILKDAAAEFGLTDPTLRVRPPQRHSSPRRERRTLTPEQFTRFLQQAQARVPDRYPEIATLALTGMRAGEVYGLLWSDMDEGVIRIQRSVSRGQVTLTKTGDPRDVAMPEVLRDILKLHKQSMEASKHRGLASGLVFPADTGGHRIPQSLHKVTKDLAKRCDIAVLVGPQVLRRTFNTLMLRAGVDGVTLRAMMGHTTEAMTQRYAGVPLDHKHEAVSRMLGQGALVQAEPVDGRPGLRLVRGGRE